MQGRTPRRQEGGGLAGREPFFYFLSSALASSLFRSRSLDRSSSINQSIFEHPHLFPRIPTKYNQILTNYSNVDLCPLLNRRLARYKSPTRPPRNKRDPVTGDLRFPTTLQPVAAQECGALTGESGFSKGSAGTTLQEYITRAGQLMETMFPGSLGVAPDWRTAAAHYLHELATRTYMQGRDKVPPQERKPEQGKGEEGEATGEKRSRFGDGSGGRGGGGGRGAAYASRKRKWRAGSPETPPNIGRGGGGGCGRGGSSGSGHGDANASPPSPAGNPTTTAAATAATATTTTRLPVRYWTEYGNDFEGTLFLPTDSPCPLSSSNWNLCSLPMAPGMLFNSGLPPGALDREEGVPGFSTPMLYIAMVCAAFAIHKEDSNAFSINYCHAGAEKIWFGSPACCADALELSLAAGALCRAKGMSPDAREGRPTPEDHIKVARALAEKTTVGLPELLTRPRSRDKALLIYRLVQTPGSFVITFPGAYHWGFSTGLHLGEAVNFATDDWLPWGFDAADALAGSGRRAVLNVEAMLRPRALAALRAVEALSPQEELQMRFGGTAQEARWRKMPRASAAAAAAAATASVEEVWKRKRVALPKKQERQPLTKKRKRTDSDDSDDDSGAGKNNSGDNNEKVSPAALHPGPAPSETGAGVIFREWLRFSGRLGACVFELMASERGSDEADAASSEEVARAFADADARSAGRDISSYAAKGVTNPSYGVVDGSSGGCRRISFVEVKPEMEPDELPAHTVCDECEYAIVARVEVELRDPPPLPAKARDAEIAAAERTRLKELCLPCACFAHRAGDLHKLPKPLPVPLPGEGEQKSSPCTNTRERTTDDTVITIKFPKAYSIISSALEELAKNDKRVLPKYGCTFQDLLLVRPGQGLPTEGLSNNRLGVGKATSYWPPKCRAVKPKGLLAYLKALQRKPAAAAEAAAKAIAKAAAREKAEAAAKAKTKEKAEAAARAMARAAAAVAGGGDAVAEARAEGEDLVAAAVAAAAAAAVTAAETAAAADAAVARAADAAAAAAAAFAVPPWI